MKKMMVFLVLLLGIAFNSFATTLDTQYEVYYGDTIGAPAVVSGPAYYLWTDADRTNIFLRWTANSDIVTQFSGHVSMYSGSVIADNLMNIAALDFESSGNYWDYSTVTTPNIGNFAANGVTVSYNAFASTGVDTLQFTVLPGYTLPSYLAFDLNIGGRGLEDSIYIGSTNGHPESSTFAIPAPVPEPGTMMMLGAGFLGLAIYGKRRKNA